MRDLSVPMHAPSHVVRPSGPRPAPWRYLSHSLSHHPPPPPGTQCPCYDVRLCIWARGCTRLRAARPAPRRPAPLADRSPAPRTLRSSAMLPGLPSAPAAPRPWCFARERAAGQSSAGRKRLEGATVSALPAPSCAWLAVVRWSPWYERRLAIGVGAICSGWRWVCCPSSRSTEGGLHTRATPAPDSSLNTCGGGRVIAHTHNHEIFPLL